MLTAWRPCNHRAHQPTGAALTGKARHNRFARFSWWGGRGQNTGRPDSCRPRPDRAQCSVKGKQAWGRSNWLSLTWPRALYAHRTSSHYLRASWLCAPALEALFAGAQGWCQAQRRAWARTGAAQPTCVDMLGAALSAMPRAQGSAVNLGQGHGAGVEQERRRLRHRQVAERRAGRHQHQRARALRTMKAHCEMRSLHFVLLV